MYRKLWKTIMHDYIELLKTVDNPSIDEETKWKLLNESYDKITRVSERGMDMADELDSIHDVLYNKWWFKLCTKLHL